MYELMADSDLNSGRNELCAMFCCFFYLQSVVGGFE